jgi:hypothetical protein
MVMMTILKPLLLMSMMMMMMQVTSIDGEGIGSERKERKEDKKKEQDASNTSAPQAHHTTRTTPRPCTPLEPPHHRPLPQQRNRDPADEEGVRRSKLLPPSSKCLGSRLFHRTSKGESERGERGRGKRGRGRDGIGKGEFGSSNGGHLASVDGGESDDGEVKLGWTCLWGDPEVGSKGWVGDGRFSKDGKGRTGVKSTDEMRLDDLMSRGSVWLEVGAELHVTKVIGLTTSTDVSLTWTEGAEVEGRRDFPVDEGSWFGGRDDGEGKASKERGRLGQGLLLEGSEGRNEAGVASGEDLRAADSLGGWDDGLVDGKEKDEAMMRSHSSIEAAAAWGAISACERIPRPPSRVGRVIRSASVGKERGEERRVRIEDWRRPSSLSQQPSMSSVLRERW